MSIIKRGPNTYLVRAYIGRDPITKRRVEVNETVRGTLSLAKKREAQLKGQKHSGQLNKLSRMTVDAVFERYLDSARHTISVTTHHKYNIIYRSYASPYIGNVSIAKIEHRDLQRLFNFLLDPKKGENGDNEGEIKSSGMGLAASSVHFVRDVLKSAFRFAVKNKLASDNPVSGAKVPLRGKPRSDSMTIEEAKAFTSVRSHFWYGNALAFQLHTGLRNQELTALTWDDVDFARGTLRIERACKRVGGTCVEIGSTKTERSNRVIVLSPALLKLLRCHHEAQQKVIEKHGGSKPYGCSMVQDWVKSERPRQAHLYTKTDLIFPNRNGEIPSSTSMHNEFKRMLRRARIAYERNLRQYDLRHTHASFLFAAGVPTIDIAERLGHSIAVCELTYGHALRERRGIPSQVFTDMVPLDE